MIIYFIRHGHPNYKDDCLTELGHKQAAVAAERLKNSGIERIFSSTNGRAMQTAEYTAEALGISDITPCNFMREIWWRSIDGEPVIQNGNPWLITDVHASKGIDIFYPDWREKEPYSKTILSERVDVVIDGFDAMLEEFGYKREGNYYRITREADYKKIAIFSHGGSSSAAISHMLNIPFVQICGFVRMNYTSITKVQLSGEVGALTYPKLLLLNDYNHIVGLTVENVLDN